MKLLKTVLLSTSLLISVPFAAEPATGDDASSQRANAIVETAKKFDEYKAKTASTLYKILNRDAGSSIPEGTVLTASSTDIEVMTAISATLKALTAKIAEMKAAEAGMKTALSQAQHEKSELAAQKEAVEAALREATDKLAALTKAKDEADRQLAAAAAEVERLSAALRTTEESATKAGEHAAAKIEGLTAELATATKERDALTDKVRVLENELTTVKRKIENENASILFMTATLNPEAAAEAGRKQAAAEPRAILKFDSDDEGASLDASSPRSLFGSPNTDNTEGSASPEPTGQTTRRLMTALTAAASEHDEVVHTGAGHTVAPVAVDVEKAAKITSLQAELATAQAKVAPSPFKGQGSQKKNAARDAAIAEVTRLTNALKELGVDPTAAAASK